MPHPIPVLLPNVQVVQALLNVSHRDLMQPGYKHAVVCILPYLLERGGRLKLKIVLPYLLCWSWCWRGKKV